MIIRIYDYNGKGKLVKIPDDCEYIEFDIPTVYINYAYREVVSTDIKYLGLLEE